MVWVSWERRIPASATLPRCCPHVGLRSQGQTFLFQKTHKVAKGLNPVPPAGLGGAPRFPSAHGALFGPTSPSQQAGTLHGCCAVLTHPPAGPRAQWPQDAARAWEAGARPGHCRLRLKTHSVDLTSPDTKKGWKKSPGPTRSLEVSTLSLHWPSFEPCSAKSGACLHPPGQRSWPQRGLQREAGQPGGLGLLFGPGAWVHAPHLLLY